VFRGGGNAGIRHHCQEATDKDSNFYGADCHKKRVRLAHGNLQPGIRFFVAGDHFLFMVALEVTATAFHRNDFDTSARVGTGIAPFHDAGPIFATSG